MGYFKRSETSKMEEGKARRSPLPDFDLEVARVVTSTSTTSAAPSSGAAVAAGMKMEAAERAETRREEKSML